MEKYHEGLIVLSGSAGSEVFTKISNGDIEGLEKTIKWYQQTFGEDYYLELQRCADYDLKSNTPSELMLEQEKVNTVPTLSIRVNRLKTTREALADELENDGFRVKMGSASQSALFISANGAAEEGIEQLKGFKEGYFTVQDEGAMLITEYLGANPGDRVLDMCAAGSGPLERPQAEQRRSAGPMAFGLRG